MNKGALILILAAVLINIEAQETTFAKEWELEEIKEVQEDIRIINLLNGLSLTKEQELFVLNRAKQVKKIKEEAERSLIIRKRDILDTYEKLKKEFLEGKVSADDELTRRFRKQKEESEQIVKEAFNKVDKISKEVEENLEEFQIIALKGYTPCIIPSEQSDRIGQSDKPTHFANMLERARNIPQQHYYLKKEEIIDRAVNQADYKSTPGIKLDKEQLRLVVGGVLEEARQMDDIDFQLHKNELAEKIKEVVNPHPKTEVKTIERIKRFLLIENIIPILEDKIYKSK